MANHYVSSVGWTAVTAWAASTAYIIGDLRRQLAAPTVGNERVMRCTTAGTSGGAEPTWSLAIGGTTADNDVVWTDVTGQEAYQAPGAWAAPFARLQTAANTFAAASDQIFVADDHAETTSAALVITSTGTVAAPQFIACVESGAGGTVPPLDTDVKIVPTASVATTGNSGLTLNGSFRMAGMNIGMGTGAVNPTLIIAGGSYVQTYDNCALNIVATGASAVINVGLTTAASNRLIMNNCTVSFGATGQSFATTAMTVWNMNGGSIGATGSVPTTLFTGAAGRGANVTFEGVDLGALSGTLFANDLRAFVALMKDCKLHASATKHAAPAGAYSSNIDWVRCGASGVNYNLERIRYTGTQSIETVLYRTSGYAIGSTGLSWKIVTTSNCKWKAPFNLMPLAIWNGTAAANVTVTIEGIVNAATRPTNDDIWPDIEYLGAATSPLGTFKSGTKLNQLGTGSTWAASSEAWDAGVTARANSTAYSTGDMRKVASNAGRVFFCTTAGTTAASEPAGYASAVDGGSVTDGTAVFRAGARFKMEVTLSSPQPAQAGELYAHMKAGPPSSTFWIDPTIALS